MPQAISKRELETQLIEKCWKDPAFQKEVVSDPKSMLEKYVGQKLPPQLQVFVHEEDANTLHFSIPPAPSNLAELSDEDLQKVAGGTDAIITIAVGVAVSASLIGGGAAGKAAGW